MLHFKKWLLIENIQGEYWIMDGGQAMFADGDVGDYNHEAYVVESILSGIRDSLSRYISQKNRWSDTVDYDEMVQDVAKNYAQEKATQNPQLMQLLKNDPFEVFALVAKEHGIADEELEIAAGGGDAREYAMKKWKWKRLEGYNVETWTLTKGDLNDISSGLWDAYQDEAENSMFNIYVYTTGKWYNDVPFSAMNDLMQMRQHQWVGH